MSIPITEDLHRELLKRFSNRPCTTWAVVVLLGIPMQEDRCVPIRWICESGRSSTAMPG